MIRISLRILFVFILFLPSIASAKIYLDATENIFLDQSIVTLKYKSPVKIPVTIEEKGTFLISIRAAESTYKDLRVYVCSEEGFYNLNNKSEHDCIVERVKEDEPTDYNVSKTGKYFVWVNTFKVENKDRKVSVKLELRSKMLKAKKEKLSNVLDYFDHQVNDKFNVPDITISYAHCGEINAYSRGSNRITVCSELVSQLEKNKNYPALAGIIFHELGHALLKKWNAPGFDHETMVDEFAVVMLFHIGKSDWVENYKHYFDNGDPVGEAARKMVVGSRHPISNVRKKYIEEVVRNPKAVMNRWNKILYKHMNDSYLEEIKNSPKSYQDAALAGEVLDKKVLKKKLLKVLEEL